MFDVVVIGAGPAGSAAAAVLGRKGCRTVMLDRARFPRPKPCGDYLNPGCAAVLDRIGALRTVADRATPVAGMRIFAPDGAQAVAKFAGGTGYALPRSALDHLLVEHAAGAGASIVEEASAVGIDRGTTSVRVLVERGRGRTRGEHYEARMVIGADGLRSRVARAIGAGDPPRRGRFTVGGYLDGLAPVAGDGDRSPCGEIHLGAGRYCGVAHLAHGLANVTIALGRRELTAWRGRLEARYWTTLRDFPGLGDRLANATLRGPLQTSGPLAFWRRRASSPRVVLAGDAAAFIDPMTGQGVYLALRGGELAAGAILAALGGDGPARPNVAAYERARRRAFGGAFLVSRVLQRVAFRPSLASHAVRRMATRPDLGTGFINAVGNVERAASVFRPGFIAALLGL